MQAAFDGSQEIGFTIVSMTLSLAAVFIPMLFMGGIVGRLHARVRRHHRGGDSGFGRRVADPDADALQPLPQAAARHRARPPLQRDRVVFDAWLRWLRAGRCARPSASRARRSSSRSLLLVATVYLFTIVPTGFIPSVDTGQLSGQIEATRALGSTRWSAHQNEVMDVLAKDPERRRVHRRTSAAAAAAGGERRPQAARRSAR